MNIVTAVRPLEKINNGCTRPYYVLCDDGEIYAVKFKQNPQGIKILANEYVSAELAAIMNLPLATPSFIRIDDTFIEYYASAINDHVEDKIQPGIHFGTKKIKKTFQITNHRVLEKLRNIEVVPDIVLFDHFICNKDRDSNGGNLLIDGNKMEIAVLDHTHVFDLGTIWTASDLQQRIGQKFEAFDVTGYVYKKLVPYVKGNNPFHSAINNISRITESHLWNIINNIPAEWNISDQEKRALQAYLWDRANRIEDVLPILKPLFPFWKGGP